MIGNLGRDPEQLPSQTPMCRFTVAVTKKGYTTQSGVVVPDHTEWFNVLCVGKNAEIALQYLHKGDKVYAEGETYTSEFIDQQGVKTTRTEVRCERFEMLTPKQQPQTQQYAPQPQPAAPQYQPSPQPQQQVPVGVYGQAVQQPSPQPQPQVQTQQPTQQTYWP